MKGHDFYARSFSSWQAHACLDGGYRGRRGLGPCAGGWNFEGPENVRCIESYG